MHRNPTVAPARRPLSKTILLGAVLASLPACGTMMHGEHVASAAAPKAAICVLQPVGNSGVSGTLELTLTGDVLRVAGTIEGLKPGLHGFHVHEFGDLRDRAAGNSAGGHFSPLGHQHGRPDADVRHVGDLGNVRADEQGVAHVDIRDTVIKLSGADSVLGRCLVVHAGEDKFTQPSGDAGDRVAIGVIGVAAAK